MRKFWKREIDLVDEMLRSARPEAPEELVDELGGRVSATVRADPRRWSRTAFATAFAVFMLGSFASFGGMGYASESAVTAGHTVKRALSPAKSVAQQNEDEECDGESAAENQYCEEEVEESFSSQPSNPTTTVVKVAGATGAAPAATTDTLPFTGYGLGATAAIGSLLLAFGMFLRRRESRD